MHEPTPVAASIAANGFVLIVDPAGTPGQSIGPSYHNVTIGSVTVPVVLCPNQCNVPTTPTADADGGVTVSVTRPFTCTVSFQPTAFSCDPAPCDPLDPGGCGLPDPRDQCLRDDTDQVPECFVPVVVGCDALDPISCYNVLIDLVFDAVELVLAEVEDLDDLCDGVGTFPTCLVPMPDCADNPPSCAPPPPECVEENPATCIGDVPDLSELLGTVIPPCSTVDPFAPVYVCQNDSPGLLGKQIKAKTPLGITRV